MLSDALLDFKNATHQVDALIANAHRKDFQNNYIFPESDRHQITVAAFLNLFIAWEAFLERSFTLLMSGASTLNGKFPHKFVSPSDPESALNMLIGVQKYFDFGNVENVRKIAKVYFLDGVPFEPALSSIFTDLCDLRTMRNASAHISASTRTPLESLANRIMGMPQVGITLYELILANLPRTSNETVLTNYRDKLIAAAELITHG
jgi:hypothetical protein